MTSTFRTLVSQKAFDLIVFHGKSVFPVVADSNHLPMVVDFCDATSMRIRNEVRYAGLARRIWLWLRYAEVRRIERGILRKTPHVAFIARRDRDAILGPNSRAEILPNGVDHQFWHRQTAGSTRNCIAFSGVMSYGPNNDAALFLIDHIAPRIRQTVPDLEILIIGRDPSPALLTKAAQTPNVTVTGFVDDVRPFLERAAVFAAPLRYASGTQNKVLEAMSMAIPTVTTSIVADGLRMDDADEPPVVVADDEHDFADAVVRLLRDPQERSTLASRGRAYVENHFIWSRSAEKLERMCLAALGPTRLPNRQLIGATS
jgi:glycosyltransferase involved in cell wall biosynthesis